MGMISKFKLQLARYRYYEYIIETKQEIARRKLPPKRREMQEKKDKKLLPDMIVKMSKKRRNQVASESKWYFENELAKGNITEGEHEEIIANLEYLENKVEKNVKLRAEKGTAKECQKKLEEEPSKTKRTIKKVLPYILVAGVVVGGLHVYGEHEIEEALEQLDEEFFENQEEKLEAEKILNDKKSHATDIAETADSYGNDLILINEVKDIYTKQYKKETGEDLGELKILKNKSITGKNTQTGEYVHAANNLPYYVSLDEYEINYEGKRYVVLADGIPVGECTEDGEIYSDSTGVSYIGSKILVGMVENGMLEDAISLSETMQYTHTSNDLVSTIESFYENMQEYCDKNGINNPQKYGNTYIHNREGEIIACIPQDIDEKEIEEALKIVEKTTKNMKEIESDMKELREINGIQWVANKALEGWDLDL